MSKWKKRQHAFVYRAETAKDQRVEEASDLWGDGYLKIRQRCETKTTIYTIAIDRRRNFSSLTGEKWIALFFGEGVPRKSLRGKVVWKNRRVVVSQFGNRPRTYLIAIR